MAKFEDLLKRPLSEDYLPDEYKHEEANATDLPGDVSRDDVALGYIAPAMVDTVNEMAGLGPSAPVPFRPKGELEDLMSQYKDVKRKKEVENEVKSRMPASEDKGPSEIKEANKKLQAANAPKSDDEVMGDIEAQETNLKKQLKDGTISQAQFDLKQADLMAKAQGLGLAGEREMASRGEDREVAGIASPDQEQKEIVDFTGMTEREKLEYLRAAAQGRDDEMTFLDDIMKAGAIANQALASQGGYKVAQAKLPSMKTDMASRYDKLIKEYDALNKKEKITPYQKMMLEARKNELSAKSERERRIAQQQQIKAARDFLKDDPRYKKAIEQASTFDEVGSLINAVEKEKNQAALAALGTKLARSMGEVGVLTDADVIRYLGQRSWGRQLLNWKEGGMEGTLPEETIKELKSNIGIFDKKLKKDLKSIYSNARQRLIDNFGIDEDRASKLTGRIPIVDESRLSEAQERGIEKVMKKNNISRKEAIEALKKAGKL